ncbi:hypothetical protein [Amycolatopsis silviterrae]|uniref:Peptidase inhibitor family I36 protein n=1 Tax=Amycolatopsis silviterrae TaxID=1656914 RepID=A0ABW5HK04_9PSEU
MNTLRKVTVGATAAIALAALPAIAQATEPHRAPEAQPMDECKVKPWFCGFIRNLPSSNQALRVTTDWPRRNNPSTWVSVPRGKNSREVGVLDADGYWVARGCTAYQGIFTYKGPQWVQVHDLPSAEWQVKYRC